MMRSFLILGGLALVLGVSNFAIAGKEQLLDEGAVVLLELAPVDPRSLIQGDYMRLDYGIARALTGRVPRDGHIVIRLDDEGVAEFVRWHDAGQPLAEGEHLLRYRYRNRSVRIATNAFHFQEGHAERYASARYGELRVGEDGESVLVGLRDSLRRPFR